MAEEAEKKKSWVKRHKVLTGVLVFVVLVIIGSASGGSDKKTGTNQTASPAQKAEDTKPTPTPVAPKVYQGTGDDVLDVQKPGDGMAIVRFECSTCTQNTVVKTNGSESLLVNTIGGYSGSHLIDTGNGSNTTQLTITAGGAWKVTVSSLDAATPASGPVNGKGDTVLYLTGKTTKAAVTNTGDANFVVQAYSASGGFPDLAVNTIGSYKGTVPMKAPAYIQITSNGNWTVTPQ
jgi:hypothetical protein